MAVDFAAQLRVLQDAQGQPAKLALATVDLTYPELPDAERLKLKAALEAAAIPHWCDEGILAALLELPIGESAARLTSLSSLSVVEPFPARGDQAINVHEASRLALRKGMAADEPARFRVLSARATAYFGHDPTKAGRVEWIYHLLCIDPESGANELEKLNRDWSSAAHSEDRYALPAALRELENSGVVQGRARAWALIVTAWSRHSRGEAAQLAGVAGHILGLAKSVGDLSAEVEAQALLGDALHAQGRLTEAQAEYRKYLSIGRRLSEQEPSNSGWQSVLAAAHIRLGRVFEAQGELAEAQAAFAAALAIVQRLAEQEPNNPGRQRDLAVGCNWLGGVFEAQAKLPEALAAFAAALAILQRLVEQDPRNARWQRELAVAHSRVGGVFEAQGDLAEAQAAFAAALAINQRLTEQDPSHAGWQWDLAVAHNRVGAVSEAHGKPTEARAAFEAALTILQRLVEQDPTTVDWQRDLAVTYNRLGAVFKAHGKLTEAQAAFDAALAIEQHLTN